MDDDSELQEAFPIYRELMRIFGAPPSQEFFLLLPLVNETEALVFLRGIPTGTPASELPALALAFRAANRIPVLDDDEA